MVVVEMVDVQCGDVVQCVVIGWQEVFIVIDWVMFVGGDEFFDLGFDWCQCDVGCVGFCVVGVVLVSGQGDCGQNVDECQVIYVEDGCDDVGDGIVGQIFLWYGYWLCWWWLVGIGVGWNLWGKLGGRVVGVDFGWWVVWGLYQVDFVGYGVQGLLLWYVVVLYQCIQCDVVGLEQCD